VSDSEVQSICVCVCWMCPAGSHTAPSSCPARTRAYHQAAAAISL